MNKKIVSSFLLAAFCGGLLFVSNKKTNLQEDKPEFAAPGMVAYAASYSDSYKSEPQYSTQDSMTFQYLNLRNTLNYYRGDSVKVGIIDSGINYDHEDFMVNNSTKVKGDSKYYSGSGTSWVYYKASQHGYSYIDDSLGHGTNVAATVAAAINSVGGLGLAPNVELYVYKVTNSSNGYEFGAIQQALMDAQTLGLDVINMSFQSYEHAVSYNGSSMAASPGCSTVMSYYINQAYNAGITLVAAAGNYNTDEPSYPGSNNHVINVGSLNQTGTDKAGFSNYGSTIDLVAPGYIHVASNSSNSSYKDTQGTSFSAPLVTAAIALYKQQNPSATPAEIETALYASCDEIDDSGSAYTNWAGHGSLNVANFLGITEDAPSDIIINNPEVVNEELELVVDETLKLNWTVNGYGTFDDTVNFYTLSGEESVVSIDSNGKITAIGEGTEYVVIESNQDPNVYTSIYVTVSSASKLIVGSNGATWTSNSKTSSATVDDVTFIVTGTGSNDGKYYSSDNTWRFYTANKGLTISVPAGNVINSVILNWNHAQFVTPSLTTASGTASPTKYTVTSVGVNSLTFNCGSDYVGLKSAVVKYSSGKTLSSISISNQKTAYFVGDDFVKPTVTATFSDNSQTTVTNSATFTGYNLSNAGNQTVTVSYTYGSNTRSTTYGITVTVVALTSLTLSGSYKTSFDVGDTFSFGGTVTANYNNGDTADVTSDATFAGYDMSTDGNQTVTVSYGGQSTSYQITVNAVVQSQTLTITRSSFSSSGGYAWYDWSATTTDSISISGKGELYTTTTTSMQFNKSSGNKVAALFNTTAIPGSITRIEATTASGTNKTWNAYVTSTACSASGSTLTFGSNKTTVGSNVTIGTSSTTIGTSAAGYSYFCLQENTTGASYLSEIKITYTPKSISSIAVKTAPTKTSYEAGDNFDPTGLVITATYSDNTTKDVTYNNDTASSFSFAPSTSTALTTSNTSVIITYGGKSCNQVISVSAAKTLTSISVSGQTTSFVEGDEFEFGGTVTAHFSDSSSSNVTTSATFTGYTMTTLGNQTVTASYTYKGKTETANYTINVGKGTPSSLSVSGQTVEYVKNASFSFDGTCTVTFENGYQKVVTPTSVTSPDMSVAGNKTITVSYTYNEVTVSTTYNISVNAYRTVMEEVTTTTTIGSVVYTSGSAVTTTGVSVSTSGYTTIESAPDASFKAIRLGSNGNKGTLTVTSTSSFNRVVVNARTYSNDTSVSITIGGTSTSITNSYQEYTKEYSSGQTSVAIATTSNGNRAWINSVTLYFDTTTEQDIGQTEDCVGLESFINTYMHMDYTENLGYCNDSTHHYYSTAKAAFNNLNDHQRTLFTTNSAYSVEYARLVAWASFNGDSLNSTSNKFEHFKDVQLLSFENKTDGILIIVAISTLLVIAGYLLIKKKKEN